MKKTVFLFGAGAVIDWGGPRTVCSNTGLQILPEHGESEIIKNRVCCLTHLITATGYKTRDGGTVTQMIYDELKAKHPNIEPNFEQVLHGIEELFNVFCRSNHRTERDILPWHAEIRKLIDYVTAEKKQHSGNYSFTIPGREDVSEAFVSSEVSPEELFFRKLYHDQLHGIVGHISKYAWHSAQHSKIFRPVNDAVNRNFVKWMNLFTGHLRMYSLNYESVFPVLLRSEGMEVFEGFYEGTGQEPYVEVLADVRRIVTDHQCNVFYNLHGNAKWRIRDSGDYDLQGYQVVSTSFPNSEEPSAVLEIENGQQILVANIISGFQKVQKTFLTPMRQMLSAFDRDCIEGDALYIIGYSFSDEHINEIIRNARRYNSEMTITLVNPVFDDLHFLTRFMLHWKPLTQMPFRNVDDEIISEDYKVKVIQKTFADFLADFA